MHGTRHDLATYESVTVLPEMLYVTVDRPVSVSSTTRDGDSILLGLESDDALYQSIQATFHGLGMTFERRFAPAVLAIVVCHFDKQPPRWYSKMLDDLDLRHCRFAVGKVTAPGEAARS